VVGVVADGRIDAGEAVGEAARGRHRNVSVAGTIARRFGPRPAAPRGRTGATFVFTASDNSPHFYSRDFVMSCQMVQSYLPLVLLASVVGMVVAFVTWISRERAGARPLTVFLVAASFWSVAEGLSIATAGSGTAQFWTQVGLSLSVVIPLAWLATVLEYTGNGDWLRPRTLALLAVEPLLFVGLVWTNASHGLVWTGTQTASVGSFTTYVLEFGIALWAHQVYSYMLVTVGALLLVWLVLRAGAPFRGQSTALLAAITLPMVGNAAYLFRLVPPGVDPTAVGYVLSGIVVAVAMFRRQLFDLAPVARELGREAALSDLDDSVVILDDDDRIVDANPAAERLLDIDVEPSLGRTLEAVSPELAGAVSGDTEETELQLEHDGRVRYYDVRVSPLYRGRGILSGRVLSLRDVTEHRRREQRLDVLNRLLRHNLRNELNVVRGNVELAQRQTADETIGERLASATDTIDEIVQRSEKIGAFSRTDGGAGGGAVDIGAQLVAEPDLDRDPVALDLPEGLFVTGGPPLSLAFGELVTNAIEHNDGDPAVTVTVDEDRTDGSYVVVAVQDNGPGIDEQEWRTVDEGEETVLRHASGIGLWLVTWIVEQYGGRLAFENTADGCTARVWLPRADGQTTPGRAVS
jgi:PAS domain S-box-containing protein